MVTDEDYQWFRVRIAERRRSEGWSVNKAAKRAGIAPKTWTNTERGEYHAGPGATAAHVPDLDTVSKIARALGIVQEVNERFGESISEVRPAAVTDQIRDLRGVVLDVVRRLDEIEDQLEP
jgi:transcriptional regulator with XRE-family HTH domain